MKKKTILIVIVLIGMGSLLLTKCKKNDEVTPLGGGGTPLANLPAVDTTWVFDKAHCNVGWASKYYDFSNTVLTGRFNMFGLKPFGTKGQFIFDENDLSNSKLEMWVQLSTFNTGESGRDGLGKCGPSYVGVFYLDSLKTQVNPVSDTAWFRATSFTKSGNGYVVKGNFTFNHYRPASGFADKTPIIKPVTMFITYNGAKDFDSNNDGVTDKYRAGFTGKFSFNRSDYFDISMTKAYDQYFPNDPATMNNKTWGNWSTSVADQMDITVNVEMYQNH